MEYRSYVTGSPDISVIGFGAWQLGNTIDWKAMTETEAITLVHKALEAGVNFFDTAPNYGLGNSEILLGKAFKSIKRESIVINTKFGHHKDGHTDYGHEAIKASVEGSLKRLGTDYVDSVLLHNPPADLLKEEGNAHYEVLERLKEEGKILAYGASLDRKEEMEAFIRNTKGKVIEAFFNILHQDVRYAFDLAKENGVKIIAKIPLDSGWLTGKYNNASTFEGIRTRWTREDIEVRAELVDELRTLPAEGQSLAQFALQYCLAYDEISTVIPGAVNREQLLMNLGALTYPMNSHSRKFLESFYEQKVIQKKLVW
ncbi:MAG: aldo/keto reductase [Herbinix sp.]|nr:aldo/keto reductase [Herbinix sp.]